jgi:N-methylhydantoinase A
MATGPVSLVVGADVGGTFTDFVATDTMGTLWVEKVPSTPEDPGLAVVTGLERLCASVGVGFEAVSLLLHGTTIATNALLQRRGARTALLTTRGFRDVLEIGRQSRPRLFDFDATRPEPLVPRADRLEVNERMDALGTVLAPLNEKALRSALEVLRTKSVESLAVCFLHSYANSAHEQAAADIIARAWPGVHVSLSSEVLPEYREYERMSTTVANAFVAPVMTRYLAAMEGRLRDRKSNCTLRVMQSNGGLMSIERASRLPAATVLSGIAAGALGGVRIGHQAGRRVALTLDMGGTSCDMALGIDGEAVASRACEIGGLPVRLPALDVHTIGAGGGSIAYLDSGGALRVGPRSAGAVPGPACYGLGGEEPTVTDANLVLGRIPETGLLGGAVPLDRDLATAAIRRVAEQLDMSIPDTAAGIVRVINAGMARQMRVLTIERGIDPRDCSLVAFGGSGPVHAAELAHQLEMPEVIVPQSPGVTSALGLLLGDIRYDRVQTVLIELPADGSGRASAAQRLEAVFAEATEQILRELAEASDRRPTLVREVEMRYRRQGHELRVPAPPLNFDENSINELEQAFHGTHRERFGYDIAGEPILIVNALLAAAIPSPAATLRLSDSHALEHKQERRRVMFEGEWYQATVIDRESPEPGLALKGPLIVEQFDSTTVVPPRASIVCDEHENLVITLNDF